MTPKDGKQLIEAEVPMLELYGYSTSLRSITGGSGEFEYVVSVMNRHLLMFRKNRHRTMLKNNQGERVNLTLTI